jgi:hypothetical protein
MGEREAVNVSFYEGSTHFDDVSCRLGDAWPYSNE